VLKENEKSMNTVDLHIHSHYSDGSQSVREIIHRAHKKKLKAISITDHDTIAQNREALEEGRKKKLEVITGVEVSAEYEPGTLHILGYFFDRENTELYEMLERFKNARDDRNPQIVQKLNELGIPLEYEDVLREASGIAVGRPHIARAMLKKGFVQSMGEAFDKYLSKGKPAYVNRDRLSAEEIIMVLQRSGGLAVLAHPFELKLENMDELDKLVGELITKGLQGIEVYSSCHSLEKIKDYEQLADKYNLLRTGGSDYHGDNKPKVDIGFVGEGIELSYEIVERMKDRIKTFE
jgi:3',5'-nucleoside bisphosphate phosphatase